MHMSVLRCVFISYALSHVKIPIQKYENEKEHGFFSLVFRSKAITSLVFYLKL